MQSLTAPATASSEDIDDVLGRFHAWANSRKPANKAEEMIDGVRELSYEEALQSSRRRWQAQPQTLKTEPPPDPPKQQFGADPDPIPIPIEIPKSIAASIEDHNFDEESLAPDTVTLSAGKLSPAKKAVPPPTFGTVLSETVLPENDDPEPLVPRPLDSGPLALVWPAAGKPERQVSMSLRVAASEQALIKARAAEAGLSVSAYLRQCALEVEKLRAQVHHTLAMLEQNPSRTLAAGPPPVQVSPAGFLTRLCQRIFGGSRQLTLRA
jgi:hypothetical protein